jgi:LCP family protein required for cell wall assembly
MIEDELRRAFERHEHLVPDATVLRSGITATAGRRRARRRVLTVATAVLVVLALAVPAAAARSWFTGRAPGAPAAITPDPSGRPLNFLIAGLDDSALPGSRPGAGDHADTVVVVHVPADRSRVYLITIPRDMFTGPLEQDPVKLNATYSSGGFSGLSAAVSTLTGLSFDGAATVDLVALAALTDAVGGVHLCVDYAVTSFHTGFRFPVGCRDFNGAEATDYLRQRYNFEGVPDGLGPKAFGAIIRDRHQVDFLRALLAKLDLGGLLGDPLKLPRLMAAAGHGLVVDTRQARLLELAAEVRPALHQVVGLAVPADGSARLAGQDGFVETAEGRDLFDAVGTDQLAGFVAAHPDVLMKSG